MAARTPWPRATAIASGRRCSTIARRARSQRLYDGGKIEGGSMLKARWDLLPRDKYMIASVQTVRGCPKHCSFCSVWRTDGQKPRVRESNAVIEELVELRRRGFRFVALADDNFYPVTLEDLRMADRRADKSTYNRLKAIRDERFALMEELSKLPSDMNFFTQITMEAAEDPEYLDAMAKARIRGALVGIESVTPEGLKDVYKDFNLAGDALAERLQEFKKRGVHVLGSFIFGLPSDNAATFDATAALAQQANVTLAQFVMLTPFPGTLDFQKWESSVADSVQKIDGIPVTRHWLIPKHLRPKVYAPHPVMSADEIRSRTQGVWDEFYRLPHVWQRAKCVKSIKSRLAFVMISKLYRQMYANTGISTDSARSNKAHRMTRLMAKPLVKLFAGAPMPQLQVPELRRLEFKVACKLELALSSRSCTGRCLERLSTCRAASSRLPPSRTAKRSAAAAAAASVSVPQPLKISTARGSSAASPFARTATVTAAGGASTSHAPTSTCRFGCRS